MLATCSGRDVAKETPVIDNSPTLGLRALPTENNSSCRIQEIVREAEVDRSTLAVISV